MMKRLKRFNEVPGIADTTGFQRAAIKVKRSNRFQKGDVFRRSSFHRLVHFFTLLEQANAVSVSFEGWAPLSLLVLIRCSRAADTMKRFKRFKECF